MFIRAMVRIFSFGERWNVPFNSAVASLNGTFHLSPNENILTIARINIHYLYRVSQKKTLRKLNRLSCIINVAKQFNFYIGRKNSYLAFQ